ncbi:hypothetical protein DXG03_006059 [Asterophora parasitica]|uniref:Uncharacterized protein n=1 Tax=Asterophora parasitica TaxID=117018 RepID=A0A9P7G5A0_9AGAR|nr:hypothetical protein DXG03_006059 [Asterophora parasitica]
MSGHPYSTGNTHAKDLKTPPFPLKCDFGGPYGRMRILVPTSPTLSLAQALSPKSAKDDDGESSEGRGRRRVTLWGSEEDLSPRPGNFGKFTAWRQAFNGLPFPVRRNFGGLYEIPQILVPTSPALSLPPALSPTSADGEVRRRVTLWGSEEDLSPQQGNFGAKATALRQAFNNRIGKTLRNIKVFTRTQPSPHQT